MSALLHAGVVIFHTAYHSLSVTIGAALGRPRSWLDAHVYAWAKSLLDGCGVRLSVEGLDAAKFTAPVLIMINHRSHFDTPCLVVAAPRVPVFVAKAELRRVPLMGRAMAAFGMIFLDRGRHDKALATLQSAITRIRAGELVVMFPEGSRSKDGRTLGSFKKGAFHLAKDSGAAILPVVITGTQRILPKHSLHIRSGQATLRFGSPIPTGETDIPTLMETTRHAMEALLAETPDP